VRDDSPTPPLDPARVETLSRAARAARELCELLWEAVHEELREPREQRLRELSQRISEVSATVALLTFPPREGKPPGERRSPPEPILEEPPSLLGDVNARRFSVPQPTHSEPPRPPSRSEPPPPEPFPPPEPAAHIRLVDEQAPPGAPPAAPYAAQPSPTPAWPTQAPMPGSEGGAGVFAGAGDARGGSESLRDVRREEGPSAWVDTVGRLLERHAVDGLPFAVLLVEVVDVAHIERSESPAQVNNLIAQVEDALGRALRTEDTLTRESFGRYWLVAPETNGTGARMLAERLARLVRSSASHRGVPLEVAVGIAVCPDDGIEAPTLAARADLGVYSARANGEPVGRAEPPA
jgi:GGDEF domain-containing protein